MILAAIEGNIIALIVFAAVGVINWLLQKKEEQSPDRPQSSERERPPEGMSGTESATPSGKSQDDERLRRFMEALGLPTDQSPPPTQRPQAPVPPPLPRTIPRAPAPQARRAFDPATQTVPRPFRQVMPQPPPLPQREHSLDEADAPTLPVQQIALPLLETPALPEFITVSSRIAAAAGLAGSAEPETDAYREHTTLPPAGQGRLTELLRSPDDLRRAILLREVLGPPRGIEQFHFGFRI